MKLIHYCNKVIEFSFYALFFLVPLLFSQYTSELFELNKMWTTYGITIIIATAWFTKMIATKEFRVQKTFFDIPILLFLLSQILSTLFSIDRHVSFYGYYSRFNGGLLSIITYIFLYYAFVSNLTLRHVWKSIVVTLVTGSLVALWGFPSHFGSDPTCLLFRGTFDTSCWTEAFHPTVRIFSTLGQPAWLAAYLAFLIPLAAGYLLRLEEKKNLLWYWMLFGVILLFYADLLFANTRAGYIGFLFAYVLFWFFVWLGKVRQNRKILLVAGCAIVTALLLFGTFKGQYGLMLLATGGFLLYLLGVKRLYTRTFVLLNSALLIITFLFGTPVGRIDTMVTSLFPKDPAVTQAVKPEAPKPQAGTVLDYGITDSGNIRKVVWQGAIDIWKAHPIFGTGVETYAFAYYKQRPLTHNLTSEWDYLYNKAHNEFLNYLATTGAFGLGTYVLFIGFTLYLLMRLLINQLQNYKNNPSNQQKSAVQDPTENHLMLAGLFAGFISILVTNFFGFSVVIINLYFFLIPAFVLYLLGKIEHEKAYSLSFGKKEKDTQYLNPYQWTYVTIICIVALFLLLNVFRTWRADKAYALGYNLNRVGDFQNAYMKLEESIKLREAEPVFKSEFAVNNATIATALLTQKDTVTATQFANQAAIFSNEVTTKYPNNILFWKDRFKIFYLMASVDSPQKRQYQEEAIAALEKVITLAPTDAKVMYNLGIIYKEHGDFEKAAQILEKSVAAKPDYRDAYYALALSYRDLAVDQNGAIKDPTMQQKAIETLQFILQRIQPDHKDAQDKLKEWGA